MEDGSGATVDVADEYADQRFVSQADAESWVGETWAELAGEGVAGVTLFEGDRAVYGPDVALRRLTLRPGAHTGTRPVRGEQDFAAYVEARARRWCAAWSCAG